MQTPSELASKPPRSIFGNYNHAVADEESPECPTPARHAPADDLPLQARIDCAVARAFLYRSVARFYEYPDADGWNYFRSEAFSAGLGGCAAAFADAPLADAVRAAIQSITETEFDDLLTAHLAAFGHASRGPNPTNEIEYGDLKADPLIQPHRLADLAAFYRAFGLEITEDASERVDHISVELEFMSVLAAKEAYALEHQVEAEALATVQAAQRQFLREHLGRWVPAFARRLARAVGGGPISAFADLTRCLVAADCVRVGIKPGSEEVVLRQVDEAESLCASCGLHQLPPGALETSS